MLIYVDNGVFVPGGLMLGAKQVATRMFARIGLEVQWTLRPPAEIREQPQTGCAPVQPEVIVIRIVSKWPQPMAGGTFAFALPYAHSGTRISVFYAQLQEADRGHPGLASMLLAHVLVHEITHVLQRMTRHSEEGVMRAHWTADDYAGMRRKPLEFTSEDVDLIRKGRAQSSAQGCTAVEVTTGPGSREQSGNLASALVE